MSGKYPNQVSLMLHCMLLKEAVSFASLSSLSLNLCFHSIALPPSHFIPPVYPLSISSSPISFPLPPPYLSHTLPFSQFPLSLSLSLSLYLSLSLSLSLARSLLSMWHFPFRITTSGMMIPPTTAMMISWNEEEEHKRKKRNNVT